MVYYFISLKHTKKEDEYVSLWRPDSKGYCYQKKDAGIYEQKDVDLLKDLDHNDTMPIEVYGLDPLFITVTDHGKELQRVPNCKAVWNMLGVTFKGRDMIRK